MIRACPDVTDHAMEDDHIENLLEYPMSNPISRLALKLDRQSRTWGGAGDLMQDGIAAGCAAGLSVTHGAETLAHQASENSARLMEAMSLSFERSLRARTPVQWMEAQQALFTAYAGLVAGSLSCARNVAATMKQDVLAHWPASLPRAGQPQRPIVQRGQA